MKKLSFLSALCAVMAMMLTSCTGNEELLQSMVGTWTDNDAEETVTIQFYPSTDGHTGKFIERRSYVMDGEDSDGIEMNIRCNTYITGTFTLTDERRLTYEYDLDKLTVMPEDEDMAGYTQRNIEYNNSHDNVFQFAGTEDAEVQEHLTNVLASGEEENWKEFYTNENKDFQSASYSDVKVEGNSFSYGVSGNQRVTFTRVDEDMFDANFFNEDSTDEAAE